MKIHCLIGAVLSGIAACAVLVTPARAYDSYSFEGGAGGTTKIITLAGGDYDLYLLVRREYSSVLPSCSFTGSLSGLSAPYGRVSLGMGIILEATPYDRTPTWKIDRIYTLSPGRYKLWINSPTDCHWSFMLYATSRQTAKSEARPPAQSASPCPIKTCITPVDVMKISGGKYVLTDVVTLSDTVLFRSFLPSSQPKDVAPFDFYRIWHGDTVVKTGMLTRTGSTDNRYDMYYADVHWDINSSRYLGKNTIEFVTAQGNNNGKFTLTTATNVRPAE